MGIVSLYKLLRSYCDTYEKTTGTTESINKKLRGSTIALDINNVTMDIMINVIHNNKDKNNIQNEYMNELNNFLYYMYRSDIKMIAVYDNVTTSIKEGDRYDLKYTIKWERVKQQENKRSLKCIEHRFKIEEFLKSFKIDKCIWNALVYGSFDKQRQTNRLDFKLYDPSKVKYRNNVSQLKIISLEYDDMKTKLYNVLDKTMMTSIKSYYKPDKQSELDLLKAYGVHIVYAPNEAEEYITALVNNEIADYALSNDGDLFVYGCKRFLRKTNYFKSLLYTQVIDIDKIIKGFNICPDDFKDLLIASGSDYNDALPGYNYKKNYDMIIRYGSPCNWKEIDGTSVNISNLNYDKVRKIFEVTSKPDPLDFSIFNKVNMNDVNKVMNNYQLTYIEPEIYTDLSISGELLDSNHDIKIYKSNSCDKYIITNYE